MIRLSDKQWEKVKRYFPEENIPPGRPGRKPVPTRDVLEAVLWVMHKGVQWHRLPSCYPNYKTVHRRFHRWRSDDVIRHIIVDLAGALRENGRKKGAKKKGAPGQKRIRKA
jgi:transposase